MIVDRDVPLRDLMARLATELSCLTDSAAALEDDLSDALGRTTTSAGDLAALQGLDLLRQTLNDLAIFARGLQPLVPAAPIALAGVLPELRLRDLSIRLQGGRTSAATRPDVELF